MNVHYPELFSTESIIKIISLLDSLMNHKYSIIERSPYRRKVDHFAFKDGGFKNQTRNILFSFKRGGSSYILWLAFSRYVRIKN